MTVAPVSPTRAELRSAPAPVPKPGMRVRKEVRFAVVLYGGASLAIYINGVVQEMFHLVRATAPDPHDPSRALLSDEELTSTERTYRHLGQTLDASGTGPTAAYEPLADIRTRFIVDIVSGTSAGGINGVFLAKALTIGAAESMHTLQRMWLDEGDFERLINDRESVRDLAGLNEQRPPASLLNSQRMYRKLLEALDAMDESAAVRVPLVDELDLFVTTTDVRGLPVFLRLGDEVASESRYRNVHQFRYARSRAAEPADDFSEERNPILAFAARCTSSFPVAFEPMRLSDIDDILASMSRHRARAGEGRDPSRWSSFFPDYRPPSSGQMLPDTAYDFTQRAFADGGYLDNKPFSYAIDKLSRRHGGVPADRKLIYVEPSPSHPEDRPIDVDRPDALQNLSAALFLPRQETIREDLLRVLKRNRLIHRVERILSGMERDVETGVSDQTENAAPVRDPRFAVYDLEVMIQRFGYGYGSYHRLKIAALSDHISRVMAQLAGFDRDSDEFFAIRYLVRAWRESKYAGYLADAPELETENQFLLRFDLDYRLRRLDFVFNRIDRLSCLDEGAAKMLKGRGIDLRPELEPELQEALQAVSQQLAPVYVALRQTVETLGSPATAADLAKIVAPLEALRSNEARRRRPADAAAIAAAGGPPNAIAGAMLGIGVPQKELHQLLQQPSEESRDRYARGIMSRFATGFDALADALTARIAAVTWPASDICKEVFTPDASAPDSLATQVRTILGDYYRGYDRYDLISYPILYSTDVGDEVDPVEVIRISPEDAKSLIDERKPDERRRKLAGTALMHFGAFLDRHWRQNDILWGRLDGAERLIAAVTQGSLLTADVRKTLLERTQLAIFADQSDASTIEATCGLLADAMATADGGPDAKKIRALVAPPPGASGNAVVRDALLAAAEPKRVREYYSEAYEVDRAVNSLAALRAMSRSSRVFGRLLEGIADRHGVSAAPAAWLTRASSIFWGLVEVSVPRSFYDLVFRYWLQLVYVFDILMILGGTVFVERSVQRFGLVLLGLTIAVHVAVLAIRDVIRRRRRWIRAILTLGLLGLLVLAGIGVVHAGETWDAIATWVRARF
jgi:patatin-related protein